MPTSRKPAFEKVSAAFGTSFNVKFYNDPSPQEKPPFWHFHPEVELVYVKGGNGMRHIGHHLSYYQEGDLVMIGSMLPSGLDHTLVILLLCDTFGKTRYEVAEDMFAEETRLYQDHFNRDDTDELGMDEEDAIAILAGRLKS